MRISRIIHQVFIVKCKNSCYNMIGILRNCRNEGKGRAICVFKRRAAAIVMLCLFLIFSFSSFPSGIRKPPSRASRTPKWIRTPESFIPAVDAAHLIRLEAFRLKHDPRQAAKLSVQVPGAGIAPLNRNPEPVHVHPSVPPVRNFIKYFISQLHHAPPSGWAAAI